MFLFQAQMVKKTWLSQKDAKMDLPSWGIPSGPGAKRIGLGRGKKYRLGPENRAGFGRTKKQIREWAGKNAQKHRPGPEEKQLDPNWKQSCIPAGPSREQNKDGPRPPKSDGPVPE